MNNNYKLNKKMVRIKFDSKVFEKNNKSIDDLNL